MNSKEKNGFSKYKISSEILEALSLLGFTKPTEIQEQVLPIVLAGKNAVVKSQTGTGKTAAFAIPICECAKWEENLVQALVLEPTRELTAQVTEEIFHIGRKKRLKVQALFGGFPIDKQIQTLRQKSHIAVGTPGRILDHIRRGSLKLEKVETLVIDEADLMLDMGFLEEVGQILAIVPSNCKLLLFSATLEKKIQQVVDEYMKDAVFLIQDSETETVERIEQAVYLTEADKKYEVFLNVLIQENPENSMVFCATRDMVNVLYQKLKRDKLSCGMLHGKMEQSERLKTIERFRKGRFRCFIATDVAARGIDFENISLVVNYDFPAKKETYVHRIGRTGRNGRKGKAVSLICENEKKRLEDLEKYAGISLPIQECPKCNVSKEALFWKSQQQNPEPRAEKGEVLNRSIICLSIGGGRKSKIRTADIVGSICSIEGICSSDIGIIDIRESLTYVEILNKKGTMVLQELQNKTIKGKIRKVRIKR